MSVERFQPRSCSPQRRPLDRRLLEGHAGASKLDCPAPRVGQDRLERRLRTATVVVARRRRPLVGPLRPEELADLPDASGTRRIGHPVLDVQTAPRRRATRCTWPLTGGRRSGSNAPHAAARYSQVGMRTCPEPCPRLGHAISTQPKKDEQIALFYGLENRDRCGCHAEGRGFESLQPLEKARKSGPLSFLLGAVPW